MMRIDVLLLLSIVMTIVVHASDSSNFSRSDNASSSSSSVENDDVTLPLINRLTTSCFEVCRINSPCNIYGSSSDAIGCQSTKCDSNQILPASTVGALGNPTMIECLGAVLPQSSSMWAFLFGSSDQSMTDVAATPFQILGTFETIPDITEMIFHGSLDRSSDSNEKPVLDISTFRLTGSTPLNHIALEDFSLKGIDDMAPLDNVYQVSLNNCDLKEMPISIFSGTNVLAVHLINNQIKDMDTLGEKAFGSLTELNMENNSLTSFKLDASSEQLPKLTKLNLAGNKLTSLPDLVFRFQNLQSLHIERNPMKEIVLSNDQVGYLTGLRVFVSDPLVTSACPTQEIQSRLPGWRFCVDPASIKTPSPEDDGSTTVQDENTKAKRTGSYVAVLIIGIALGCLVMGGIGFCVYKRYRQRQFIQKLEEANSSEGIDAIENGDTMSGALLATSGGAIIGAYPYHEFASSTHNNFMDSRIQLTSMDLMTSLEEGCISLYRLPPSDVFYRELLHQSPRGELWLGEYLEEKVVIKRVTNTESTANGTSKERLHEFMRECEQMVLLKHKRIAEFKGILWNEDPCITEICALSEYLAHGNLRSALEDGSKHDIHLTVSKKHAIARHIAEAMVYLHSKKLVHGRLNSFNVLLDEENSAKLNLFAIVHYVQVALMADDPESVIFVAPEVLRGEKCTEASDVYSFGVFLIELETGESPLVNIQRSILKEDGEDSPLDKSALSFHPKHRSCFHLSASCSLLMKQVIALCLQPDPTQRPIMKTILEMFYPNKASI